jgi:hypothetical protein
MHTISALHSYTHPTWLRFWGAWSLVELRLLIFFMVDADSHLKLLPTSILALINWLSTLICHPWAYSISLTQLYPPCLALNLGLWVTCGVKMMRLCHGWSWQSPQNASHIHIRHSQVFYHIDALSIGIWKQPYPILLTLLGGDFWFLGNLWSQHNVIMSWLRLTATSNYFPHPY